MFPVCGLLTSTTVLEFKGESPKYWALLDLGIHLSNLFPSCSMGYRTYSGHPHGWAFCREILEDLYPVQDSSGDIPPDMKLVWLCNWKAGSISIVQMLFSLASVHLRASWIIVVMAIITRLYCILYYPIFIVTSHYTVPDLFNHQNERLPTFPLIQSPTTKIC